jgi:hypothetical protein
MTVDLRAELMKIYADHGRIDPDLVVEVVEPENHPLHHRFTWDNAVAGPLWRREEARQLLKSVKITYTPDESKEGDTSDVRAFYAVPVSSGVYEWSPLQTVVDDPVKYKLVLLDMQREIRALRARYGHLKEYREALVQELETVTVE